MLLGQRADAHPELARRGRIDRGGGLVQQQQAGPVEHSLGQRDPRLLAGRQQPGLHIREAFEIEVMQHLVDARLQSLDAVDQPEDPQVLPHRQVARQRRVDGGEIGAAQRLAAAGPEVHSLDADGPGVGLEHPQDHAEGGGLARTVRADQAHDLSWTHLERDAIDGHGPAIGFAQRGDGQYGVFGGRGHQTCVRLFGRVRNGPAPSCPPARHRRSWGHDGAGSLHLARHGG